MTQTNTLTLLEEWYCEAFGGRTIDDVLFDGGKKYLILYSGERKCWYRSEIPSEDGIKRTIVINNYVNRQIRIDRARMKALIRLQKKNEKSKCK